MLNIISIIGSNLASPGPSKVLRNSMKGLDLIGYPYLVNGHWNSTRRLWIQTGRDAMAVLRKTRARTIVGPNTAVIPEDLDRQNLQGAQYILAGPWAVDLWRSEGFDSCPLVQWPVGIDTGEFHPVNSMERRSVMVYHKRRSLEELAAIHETLSRMGISHFTVPYGMYDEDEYRSLLSRALFVLWHGCSETQGIAMQEAMSCGVPLLVCDATTFADSRHPPLPYPERLMTYPVTSAPYFSPMCGVKVTRLDELEDAVTRTMDGLREFTPRRYVLENLSLEGQAEKLVHLWDHWGMTVEEGMEENPLCSRRFRTPTGVWLRRKHRNLKHWWGGGSSG